MALGDRALLLWGVIVGMYESDSAASWTTCRLGSTTYSLDKLESRWMMLLSLKARHWFLLDTDLACAVIGYK